MELPKVKFLFLSIFIILISFSKNSKIFAEDFPLGLAIMAPIEKFPDVSKLTADFLLQNSDLVFFSNGKIMASYMTLRLSGERNVEQVVERAKIEKCDKANFFCDSVNQRLFEVSHVSTGLTNSIYLYRYVDDKGITLINYKTMFIKDLNTLLKVYNIFKIPMSLGEMGYPNTKAIQSDKQMTIIVKNKGGLLYNLPMLTSDVIGTLDVQKQVKVIAFANDPISKIEWFYVVYDNFQGYTHSGLFDVEDLKSIKNNIEIKK